jgi:hypothetical protein
MDLKKAIRVSGAGVSLPVLAAAGFAWPCGRFSTADCPSGMDAR